jgi:ribosomal protein S18 acetylase RimI-like enzyme
MPHSSRGTRPSVGKESRKAIRLYERLGYERLEEGHPNGRVVSARYFLAAS